MNMQICYRCRAELPMSAFAPSRQNMNGQWCKQCYRNWHRQRYSVEHSDAPRPCAWCGTAYQPKHRRPSIYCSRPCKEQSYNAALAKARLESKPLRRCLYCASNMPQSMRKNAKFCSAPCNHKAHALQRKLRTRTGRPEKPGFLRAEIFERDKWRCGICLKRVDRNLRYPDLMTASLDHVVPVSEGGDNSAANLRLTHLVCNLRRRNVGGNEQLALI